MTMDTSGFYKEFEDGSWIWGPNSVQGPHGSWELTRENHADFEYPYEGWTWYDTAPQAYIDWWMSMNPDEEVTGELL